MSAPMLDDSADLARRVKAAGQRRRRADARVGVLHDMTPVGPVAKHVLELHADGFPYGTVAAVAGLALAAVRNIVDGRQETVRGTTAQALMDLDAHTIYALAPDDEQVPTFAAQRRIQALARMGWRCQDLDQFAARQGVVLASNMITQQARTSAAKYRALVAVYALLSDRVGPSLLTRSKSRARGWATPAQWDAYTIEDPKARPLSVGDMPDAPVGAWRFSDLYAAVVKASWAGASPEQGAARLRIPVQTFATILQAHRIARDPRRCEAMADYYTRPGYTSTHERDVEYRQATVVHLARSGVDAATIARQLADAGRHITVEWVQECLAGYTAARTIESGARRGD